MLQSGSYSNWVKVTLLGTKVDVMEVGLYCQVSVRSCGFQYRPYDGLNLTNQFSRKLEVFGRKLEGSYFIFRCYFDNILEKKKRQY